MFDYIFFPGSKGETKPFELGKFFHNDFERDQVDEYEVQGEDVGDLLMIRLTNSGFGIFSDWFVNKVSISKTPNTSHGVYSFPCYRWVIKELVVFEGKGTEPSVNPSICLSVCLSIYLSIYLCLSICLSVFVLFFGNAFNYSYLGNIVQQDFTKPHVRILYKYYI